MRYRKNKLMKLMIYLTLVCILLPLLLLCIWCFTSRWPYPQLMPRQFSLRGIKELFFGTGNLGQLMISSISLSTITALLTVVISTMAARAFVNYDFVGKRFLQFISILPIIVPGTVFGMGIHVLLIKMHLNNTMAGVILVHTLCALPYCIKIMTDVTELLGSRLEEQAQVLGAPPFRAFLEATLPSLIPGMVSGACMAYITSFSQYFLTLIIGGGKIKTFAIVMVPFIQNGDATISANYSVMFILSAFVVFLIFEIITKRFIREDAPHLIGQV